MNKRNLTTLLLICILFLSSCGGDKDKIADLVTNYTTGSTTIETQQSNSLSIEEDSPSLNDNLLSQNYVPKEEINKLDETLNNGDLDSSNEIIDKVINVIDSKTDKTNLDKKNKADLKYLKVGNVLNKGSYSYKEKEYSENAKKILDEIILQDPEYVDPFYSNYYLGYASEITKDYSGALMYYNKALESTPDIKKNLKQRSIILNKIGYLYNIEGDMEKAYGLYLQAYEKDKKNYYSSVNLAKYYAKKGDYKKAKEFFEIGLGTSNKLLKSEIYFSLSSLELEFNGLKPDIEKSIEYANKSILEYDKNPMGYISLARGYYMLNDSKYYDLIAENLTKSIKLNVNWYEAYYYYGLLYFDKKMYEDSNLLLMIAGNKLHFDPILMNENKTFLKNYVQTINFILYQISQLNIKDEAKVKIFVDNLKELCEINKNILDFVKNQSIRKNLGVFGILKKNKDFINLIK